MRLLLSVILSLAGLAVPGDAELQEGMPLQESAGAPRQIIQQVLGDLSEDSTMAVDTLPDLSASAGHAEGSARTKRLVGARAEHYCERHKERCYESGRIYGGEVAREGEFPHMAMIMSNYRKDPLFCGGSLISERFILTAAHCFFNHTDLTDDLWVLLGNLYRPNQMSREAFEGQHSPHSYGVRRIIVHPSFQRLGLCPSRDNRPTVCVSNQMDFALLELTRPVRFSNKKWPACLWTRPDMPYETPLLFSSGWGGIDPSGEHPSNWLRKVETPLLPHERCPYYHYDPEIKLCAGRLGHYQGITCPGDSGGPLTMMAPCNQYVVGVTSTGSKKCGVDNMGVAYSRVSVAVPWIEDIVWPTPIYGRPYKKDAQPEMDSKNDVE